MACSSGEGRIIARPGAWLQSLCGPWYSGAGMSLADDVLNGDFLSISRAITQVENGSPEARAVMDALSPRVGGALRIGLTGPPGVGKSTTVDELTAIFLARGEKVAVVVMLSPESGDGIQAMKSGLLEIADIIAINKADRGGAERMEHDLKTAFELGLRSRKEIPILATEAVRGKGIPELVAAIDRLIA